MNKLNVLLLILSLLVSGCNLNVELLTPTPLEFTAIATQSPTITALPIAGDLGWGEIYGKITDAVTDAPVAGATVTCEHHSYTSPATCSATVRTDEAGKYVFEKIFFHDTDSIKLTVQATGYQTKEFTQSFLTLNYMEVNISLSPAP